MEEGIKITGCTHLRGWGWRVHALQWMDRLIKDQEGTMRLDEVRREAVREFGVNGSSGYGAVRRIGPSRREKRRRRVLWVAYGVAMVVAALFLVMIQNVMGMR